MEQHWHVRQRTDAYQLSPRRCFAHRAWTTRRNISLRSSGLILRHRAAPKPTAVRVIGGGESLRLAMSSSSIAKSIRVSAGSPVCLTIDFSRFARRTPRAVARSEAMVGAGVFLAGFFIRTLVASASFTPCRVEVHMSGRLGPRYRPILLSVAAILLAPSLALAQSPWERAASNLALTFTGPLARSLALVSIVIGGLLFMFGEAGAKRQISGIVFGGGLALFAAQFLTWLF